VYARRSNRLAIVRKVLRRPRRLNIQSLLLRFVVKSFISSKKEVSMRVLSLRSTLFSAAVLACISLAAQAQTSTWKIDPSHSGVQFEIRHLGVSNVRGSFAKPTGTIQLDEKDVTGSSVEASIDTTSVSTGEPKRDDHLKSPDFFDVAKFPTMTFKSTSLTRAGGKLQLIGDLTLAGVTKSVTLDLDGPAAPMKTPQGKIVSGFSASGTLSRKNFNFGSKYGSPMLGDDVKFTIDVEMDKQ
jgi:polyisoprenoid-binding protein YceI